MLEWISRMEELKGSSEEMSVDGMCLGIRSPQWLGISGEGWKSWRRQQRVSQLH